ncbi:hypothetical protein E2I00_017187, partial [Balaenoptera physalus]
IPVLLNLSRDPEMFHGCIQGRKHGGELVPIHFYQEDKSYAKRLPNRLPSWLIGQPNETSRVDKLPKQCSSMEFWANVALRGTASLVLALLLCCPVLERPAPQANICTAITLVVNSKVIINQKPVSEAHSGQCAHLDCDNELLSWPLLPWDPIITIGKRRLNSITVSPTFINSLQRTAITRSSSCRALVRVQFHGSEEYKAAHHKPGTMMFRDHVGILAGWFKEWNECEQTVALLSLLKLVTHIQARFLQLCLEHSLSDYNDIHLLESEANSVAIVSQWQQESKENTLALWLSHLEDQLASGFRTRPEPTYHSSQGSNEWGSLAELGPGEAGPAWQDKPPKENGQMPFHPPSSVLPAINSIGSNTNAGLPCQIHPSPLKHSMLLIPTKPQAPAAFTMPDHAPLSPQSSVASSGSEQMEKQGSSQNTFQEDGSGMKDVPSWLKSLCFHKCTALFSQMSYEEMMTLTEQHLESQNVTKGVCHKIALSIQKLRERQSVLKSLEKDVLEGNLPNALQEIQQIVITPMKAYSVLQATVAAATTTTSTAKDRGRGGATAASEAKDPPAAEGYPLHQLQLPLMTVSQPRLPALTETSPERITSYLQFIENCLTHEAFTEIQKKWLLSWKQQMLKLLHTFLHKATLEMQNHWQQKGWAFGSNSLPTAGSVGMGVARRTQRQFPMPPRAFLPGRLGLLSPSGGNNSMPSQSCSSVRHTHSLPVHLSPQAILMFPPDCPVPGPDLEINPTLESLCLNMTEHALGGLVAERLEGKRQQGGSLAVMWTYEKTRPPGLVGSGPFGSSSSSYTVVKAQEHSQLALLEMGMGHVQAQRRAQSSVNSTLNDILC